MREIETEGEIDRERYRRGETERCIEREKIVWEGERRVKCECGGWPWQQAQWMEGLVVQVMFTIILHVHVVKL